MDRSASAASGPTPPSTPSSPSTQAPPPRFALVDVNNFYASCETVFNPKLRGRPVVVLSNNDGCVVARNAEAKALGIKMTEPWHLVSKDAKAKGVFALSSNYALYADMSQRVMNLLAEMAPRQEVYSIDETFLDFTGSERALGPLRDYGLAIRARVQQWTGLTVCVGTGSTKTRAKLANHVAKKNPEWAGSFDLEALSPLEQQRWLSRIEVGEVWGVGRRLAPKLNELGIQTVEDLRQTPPKRLRAHFGVVVERIVEELNGISCLALDELVPPRQQILSSKSFGRPVIELRELREATLSYLSRATEKLRAQGSEARVLQVGLRTNPFKQSSRQYHRSLSCTLPEATDDLLTLSHYASQMISQLYREGYEYQKALVMLTELSPKALRQNSLFSDEPQRERRERLNSALGQINRRYGRNTLALAGAGIDKPWGMRQANLSPRYTTDWSQLPRVH